MAAPAGNKFWQNRSKHGRDKLFASPELLWNAAEEYFQWCDDNPWYKKEAIKSGDLAGQTISVPTARPYTIRAFLLYINANESYWRDFKSANHEGFSSVIDEIENVIYSQKFEGAAVGVFNANIIARDLGLKEAQSVDHTSLGEKIETVVYRIPDNGRFKKEDTATAAGVPGESTEQPG